MTISQAFRLGSLATGLILIHQTALAQFPRLPGISKRHKDNSSTRRGPDDGSAAGAQGVPIPPDSPVFQAFERLGQQSVYRQRTSFSASDPRMEQMMAEMGFGAAEITTMGDLKQVSMHFKLPVDGHPEDFELRAVRGNGRLAKKWVSPASGRIEAKADMQIARELAQSEEQAGKSIARNLAGGPMGMISSAITAGAAAANVAAAASARKQIHDFFQWTCMDTSNATVEKREMPPLTDLHVLGEQTLNGEAVTGYEFFVHQDGRFHGPLQMFVAKGSGLPVRIAMNDARAGGSMQMDYFGFNQTGDFERPACLAESK
jgi:hypothetical protein